MILTLLQRSPLDRSRIVVPAELESVCTYNGERFFCNISTSTISGSLCSNFTYAVSFEDAPPSTVESKLNEHRSRISAPAVAYWLYAAPCSDIKYNTAMTTPAQLAPPATRLCPLISEHLSPQHYYSTHASHLEYSRNLPQPCPVHRAARKNKHASPCPPVAPSASSSGRRSPRRWRERPRPRRPHRRRLPRLRCGYWMRTRRTM